MEDLKEQESALRVRLGAIYSHLKELEASGQ
jgi:hypothetical protein